VKRVPEVGEVVRVEAWMPPGGCAEIPATPLHTGNHEVVAVRHPNPGLSPMGWPYDEATAVLRCLHRCPAFGLPDGLAWPSKMLEVGVGALRGAHEPTLRERRALREARAEMLAARAA